MRTLYTRQIAEAITIDFFLSMLNPELRGSGFSFSRWDIEKWVTRTMGTSFPSPPTDEEYALAGQVAKRVWKRCIETVGEGIPEETR